MPVDPSVRPVVALVPSEVVDVPDVAHLAPGLDASPFGAVVVDGGGTIVWANEQASRALGRATSGLVGVVLGRPPTGTAVEIEVASPTGPIIIEASAGRVLDDGLAVVGVRDVTRETLERVAAATVHERYALAARGAHTGLWDWHVEADELEVSERWLEIVGAVGSPTNGSSQRWFDRIHPEDRPTVHAEIRRHLAGESARLRIVHRLRRDDGRWVWASASAVATEESPGRPRRLAGSLTDVTDLKALEHSLRHAAVHDELTGIANRALFLQRVTELVAAPEDRRRLAAVLFCDLDRFKHVNDSLGHHVGDEALRLVAGRLGDHVRPGDTFARFGGDEFAVLAEDLVDPEDALDLAADVRRAIREPMRLRGGQTIYLDVSIGVVPLLPADVVVPEDVLRDADTAMYRAKATRQAIQVFDPALRSAADRRLRAEVELRESVESERFTAHFQPIRSLDDHGILAVEALARCQHPEHGLLEASTFIDDAVAAGVVAEISWRIFADAVAAARTLAEAGSPIQIWINVCDEQFQDPGFCDRVLDAVASAGVDPGLLCLELTERVTVQDLRRAEDQLARLRGSGMRIALDDFGTGQSSLAALHELPLDSVKVDQSFVQRLSASSTDLVASIAAVAGVLGLEWVAEGIETPGQEDLLRGLGCRTGQGYLLGRAQPLDAILRELRRP